MMLVSPSSLPPIISEKLADLDNERVEVESSDYARKTFGAQKSISSDQYHQTGSYDLASSLAAQSRLSQFSGATSISSNQYYGLPENEDSQNGAEESMLAANGFGGLEAGAREAVRNLMEQTGIEDVESLQNALRTGALKVSLFSFLFLSLFITTRWISPWEVELTISFCVQLSDLLARYA